MLQSMESGALASLAAIIGLVGRAAWPLLSTRVGFLRGQLLIGVAFAAHYALIGIATAAIVNVLGSLQTATALLAHSLTTVCCSRYERLPKEGEGAGCAAIILCDERTD